ncbi:ESCRT-0 subunit protein hse1 [Quaeritorhiza haematococci]|nr:ESCRT-0 subunit protein hse1 [Quaeritorhiza haematococci]
MDLEQLIVKATSETNTSEDWGGIIEICEKADRSEGAAREAINVLSRRITHKNVNVVLFALTVANSLVQNCGATVHREISSRAFLDGLVRQVSNKSVHEVVRNRILDLIQQWAGLFKSDPSLGFMVDTYNQLKAQNYPFPTEKRPDDAKPKSANRDREREEEELQLALALSLSAQEHNSQKRSTTATPPRKSSSSQQQQIRSSPAPLFQVRALYDFPGLEEGELRLTRGDIVNVHDSTTFRDWWKGEIGGRVGIFPSNYVEKVVGTVPSEAAGTGSGVTVAGEPDVAAESRKIQEFVSILSSIDPHTRGSLSENERLQQSYQSILLFRPRLIKMIETEKAKQDELLALNDRFTKACSTYHRLMEASLAQYRQPAAPVGVPVGVPQHPQVPYMYNTAPAPPAAAPPAVVPAAGPPPQQYVQGYNPNPYQY